MTRDTLRQTLLIFLLGALFGGTARAQTRGQTGYKPSVTAVKLPDWAWSDAYVHTAWGKAEGAPDDIWAITQTRDGFLWLGTLTGLYRFDGVLFERYQPPTGPPLPNGTIRALLALPDGGLMVGFLSGGLWLLKDGVAVNYDPAQLSHAGVRSLASDGVGTIWAATAIGLLRFDGQRWSKIGKDWNFPEGSLLSVFVDRQGTVWVTTENALLYLSKGAAQFERTSISVGTVTQIAQAPNGKLWMAETTRSVRPIPLGTKALPSDEVEVRVGSNRFLFAQDGSLWVTSLGDGLRQISKPEELQAKPGMSDSSIHSYLVKDGLTDNVVTGVFQDREGNIWVGTYGGLDRFRKSSFVPVVPPKGKALPKDIDLTTGWGGNLTPGDDGDMWILATKTSRVLVHENTILLTQGSPYIYNFASNYRDPTGAVWWINPKQIVRYDKGRYTELPLPEGITDAYFPRFMAVPVTADRNGVLWLDKENEGLFFRKNDRWNRYETPPALRKLTPRTAFTDDDGRVWFVYDGGTILWLRDGKIQTVATGRDSLVGNLLTIAGHHGQIWIGGGSGISFFDGNRFWPVTPVDLARFETVTDIEQTADGSLWLREARGVIHISSEELHRFVESPTYRVPYQIFDALDGLPGRFETDARRGESMDGKGRLWFVATKGYAWLDPASVTTTDHPPPALIRAVIADGKRFPSHDGTVLPSQTGRIEIDYSGLNLSAPERVSIRYKLDGVDKGWQAAEPSRQAFYTSLRPGKHRFHLSARNVGGEWSAQDTVFEFRVAPAWFQTIWFQVCCAVFVLFVVWALYRLRMRQVAHAMAVRFDERMSERLRIAQDLHDTLLQSVQGSKLVAEEVLALTADSSPTRSSLEKLSMWLGRATEDGRAVLNSLRTSTTEKNDLAETFRRSVEECRVHGSIEASFVVVGVASEMHPIVRDEVYRIGDEAIRNACVHSQGTQLLVELRYEADLVLSVRDNGVGIDPVVIREGKRGHFGLGGMRERAARIAAGLTIHTSQGSGTEVKLNVPGNIIYRAKDSEGRSSIAYRRALRAMGLSRFFRS